MTTDYLIKIIGHIEESKRPESFRNQIVFEFIFRCEKPQETTDVISERIFQIHKQGGMVGRSKPDEIDDPDGSYDRFIYVPIHMISHISSETTRLNLPFDVEGALIQ